MGILSAIVKRRILRGQPPQDPFPPTTSGDTTSFSRSLSAKRDKMNQKILV
jgi:hypothetical protein